MLTVWIPLMDKGYNHVLSFSITYFHWKLLALPRYQADVLPTKLSWLGCEMGFYIWVEVKLIAIQIDKKLWKLLNTDYRFWKKGARLLFGEESYTIVQLKIYGRCSQLLLRVPRLLPKHLSSASRKNQIQGVKLIFSYGNAVT